MTALPPSSDFTGSTVTEGGFKTAISSLRDFLGGLLGSDGTIATALSTIGVLASSNVAKTTAYTVVASDRGKVLECSGTFTVSLTGAATLGNGFSFVVKNSGAGVITIDPNSTELIDGSATITLTAGESCVCSCNGSAWYSIGKTATVGSGLLLGYQVFTSSGTYSKATNNPSFVIVEVVGGGGGTSAGGTSSFGAWCSATGGAAVVATNTAGAGGNGSGGDINMSGSIGQNINMPAASATGLAIALSGGTGALGLGYGNGGTKTVTGNNSLVANGGAGGGGGAARKKITVASLAASETVTIGASGGGTGSPTAGIVIVWEYK